MHWVFDKSAIFGDRAGAPVARVERRRRDLVRLRQRGARGHRRRGRWRRRCPCRAARRLVRAVVVREQRATFSLAPGRARRGRTRHAGRRSVSCGRLDGHRPAGARSRARRPSGHRAAAAVPRAQRHNAVRMTSVVIHYQEIALKGRNRPWFITTLVRIDPHGCSPISTSCDVRVVDGPDRGRARARRPTGSEVRDAAGAAARHRATSRAPGASPPNLDAIAEPACSRRSRGRPPATFRVVGAPRRQAIPAHLAGDRARARRARAGSRRAGRSISSNPALTIHVEVLTRRRVLLLRQGSRRRRTAGRHERPRAVPAVGRHRLAGRRVAHDAPRLPRALRPLPQLPDSVARVAGQGARARRAAHDATSCESRLFLVPFGEIQQQVVVLGAAGAARRRLPAADAADRRALARRTHARRRS